MAAPKVKITRDWFTEEKQKTPQRTRMITLFEQTKITKAEDFPQMLNAKEVAAILKMSPKTAASLMKSQEIKSQKIRGRRFTTPEWLQDFMTTEIEKNKNG